MITRLGCELGELEEVVLSELDEPLLGMSFPPARYIETLADRHPLSIFRDESLLDSHTEVPAGAEAVELVIDDVREDATIQRWGPSSEFPNEPPCVYEQLRVTATWSIRRPGDDLALVGPVTSEFGLSVEEVEESVLDGGPSTPVSQAWLAEIGAPTAIASYQAGSGFAWEDAEDPDSPIGFAGDVIGTDANGDLVAIAEFLSPD